MKSGQIKFVLEIQLSALFALILISAYHVQFLHLELQQSSQNGVQKTNVSAVSATPTDNQQTTIDNNLLTTLLSLICGALCKDTPLAEFIPGPSANTPLSASFVGTSSKICASGFNFPSCLVKKC